MRKWKIGVAGALLVAAAVVGTSLTAQKKEEQLSGQDRADIEALYAQYSRMFDLPEGTAAGWADVFTPDGVSGKNEGRAALEAFWKSAHSAERPWTGRHWLSQLTVTKTPEGAKGIAYYMVVNTAQKPPAIMLTGVYEDDVVKTASGWKFKRRTSRQP